MCTLCDYTIHGRNNHLGWDNALAPALRVAPGKTIEFECIDSSGGQLTSQSDVNDVGRMDFSKVNPVTGPVFIDGAEPGDALKIVIHEFKPSGIGWTANIPGFGLLADQFVEPAVATWTYDRSLTPALFGANARVPLKPFAGTMGNALAREGLHSVVPPRTVGGNLDIRDLSAGTTLYLPVEVQGALFSIGDTHAAQGDGEVCGTAVESPMNAVLTFDVVKGVNLRAPRFETSGPVSSHLDSRGFDVTTGVGPDLMRCARDALTDMIELIATRHGMPAVDAYMLASVCGDLRISEIVDRPNWVVSFYFPRCVFE